MTDGIRVETDTKRFETDTKQLASDIVRKVSPAAEKTARDIASRLQSLIPVDTGALRNTVLVTPIEDGAQVHYGGDLRYAGAIAKRTGCVDTALTGADQLFQRAMEAVAAEEVRQV